MHGDPDPDNDDESTPANISAVGQRVDRWLCNVRFFKTRGLAVEAIDNGRIEINGVRAKAAKLVRAGDHVRVQRAPYTHDVEVLGICAQRVGAAIAQTLYRETDASRVAREALRERQVLSAVREDPREGKLGKHQRRERERLKRSYE
jgi:ribosome-associated heat shock protein Hsp15